MERQSKVGSNGFKAVTNEELHRVKSALEEPEHLWRTVEGISRELKMPPARVEDILSQLSDVLIKSFTQDGRSIFTTRDHYKAKRGTFGRIISALSDAVR
jgi:hypothetical protein